MRLDAQQGIDEKGLKSAVRNVLWLDSRLPVVRHHFS